MEWWIWITKWFLFCVIYSRLFEYIIKKHETLIKLPSIHVYNNRINFRLVFKAKDGYKLELQTPEKMKWFGSTKKKKKK